MDSASDCTRSGPRREWTVAPILRKGDLDDGEEVGSELKATFVIVLAAALGFTACNEAVPERVVRYSWLSEGLSPHLSDTLTALPKHTARDSMLGFIEFTFREREHTVTGWTDDYYSPIDGGAFWLELDSLGMIYSHSTTWPGFMVVRSDNDSINELITMALAAASRPGQFGVSYNPPQPKIETVQFMKMEPVDK